MRPVLLAVVAVVLALAAGACGEKDESAATAPTPQAPAEKGSGGGYEGGGGEERKRQAGDPEADVEADVEAAVVAVVGGGDPDAACSELATARYVKRAYGDEQGCRAAVSTQGSFDVAVSAVAIDGAAASARAVPASGPNKGETIKVELVEETGVWKVDSARSNAPAGP
jgi:hypothetical protein